MVFWHMMIGLGIGIIASVLTILASGSNNPRIEYKETEHFSPPDRKKRCVECSDNISSGEMRYLDCGHEVHIKCLIHLRKQSVRCCPKCRRNL